MNEIIKVDCFPMPIEAQSGMGAIVSMVLNTVSLRSQRDYGRAYGWIKLAKENCTLLRLTLD